MPMRCEPFYHRAFEPPHHVAHAEPRAPQVEEQVRDELAGPVIRDLAAAIDLDDGDAVVAQQVLAPAGEPERVDRRMLGEPELVGVSPRVRASVNACIARHVVA